MVTFGISVCDGSGGPRIATQYVAALAKRGVAVRVLVPGQAEREAVLSTVGPVLVHQITGFPRNRPGVVLRGLRLLAARVRPAILVAPFQADLAYFSIVGAFLRVPVVYILQNQGGFAGAWYLRAIKTMLAKVAIRNADGIVSVSPNLVRYVGGYCGVSPQKIVLVNNGIFIPPAVIRPTVAGSIWRLVNVGRISEQKNQRMLVEAVRRLSSDVAAIVEVDFWGDAKTEADRDYHAGLKELIEQAGLANKVKLRGWTSDMAGKLAQSDLMVHAAKWEGSPLAVLEAFAAAIPVVTTPCFDRPEGFVNSVHGWFVQSSTPDELARAIEVAVRAGKPAAAEVGQRARKFVQENLSSDQADERFCAALATMDRNWAGVVI